MIIKKIGAGLLAFLMVFTINYNIIPTVYGGTGSKNTPDINVNSDVVTMTFEEEDFVKNISSVKLGDSMLTEFISSDNFDWGSGFRATKDGLSLKLGGVSLQAENTFVISSEGYSDLNLVLDQKGKVLSSTGGKILSGGGTLSENTPEINVNSDVVTMTFKEEDFVKNMSSVKLGDSMLTEFISSDNFDWGYGFRAAKDGLSLKLGGVSLQAENTFVISSEGYSDLNLVLDQKGKVLSSTGGTALSGGGSGGSIKVPETPKVGFENNNILLKFNNEDNYLSFIEELSIGDQKINSISASNFNWTNNPRYTVIGNIIKIGGIELTDDTICNIKASGYEDLKIKLQGNMEPTDGKKLHVRLKGSFEAAVVNQQDYDAISGATGGVTQNNNSNTVVEVALLDEGVAPEESDWKLLKDSGINVNLHKTEAIVSDEFGMEAVYSPFDSSVTLAGVPNKAGSYTIKINLQDEAGHKAVSNELPFIVYTGDEYLSERLKLEHFHQTQDGKYMWDMEPWTIKNFNTTDGVVKVPKELKAWFGSHEPGTYGKLGYPVPFGDETTQTLVIPEGCNLTLLNMDVLSSVRIVVENGGKLSLRGTPIQGIVEVQSGGTLSMNYNEFGGNTYENGSAINGQLIMQDGSTLENAAFYSNTNYIPNGSGHGEYERINSEPVVIMNGTVNIKGTVVIKGDEAASYQGQHGLLVKNGNINIEEGATLAVYGGGKSATTALGGNAIILENSSISGKGKLIAIGGAGFTGNGGHGITGTGTVNVKNAFIQGGSIPSPKNSTVVAGSSVTENIKIASSTSRTQLEGKVGEGTNVDTINEFYWNDITKLPDFSKYTIEHSGLADVNEGDKVDNSDQHPLVTASTNGKKNTSSYMFGDAGHVTKNISKDNLVKTGDVENMLALIWLISTLSLLTAVYFRRKIYK